MIDIISSSIRVGSLLRENEELKPMCDFFVAIVNDKNNPMAFEYINLVTSKLSQYGLYVFDVVDAILESNLSNKDEIARRMARDIKEYVKTNHDYNDVLLRSKKYGAVLEEYVAQLISKINDYPQIKLKKFSLKLQQSSNELSTAILRSGVLSWVSDSSKIKLLKKEMNFVGEYETQTSKNDHLHPYNKNNLNIINGLNGDRKKIASYIENIRFVQFLAKNAIMQGFLFELFEIPTENITRIKEIYSDKSIHPVIIKTNIIYPTNHLMLFKYNWKGKISYLLMKRMVMRLLPTEGTTTLYGYCYPTNEYSLFKIE